MNSIAIVGFGYFGLPLLLAYARRGCRSVGFDIDSAKPRALLDGRSYIKHVSSEGIADAVASGRLDATTDFARISEADGCDAVVLATRHKAFDLAQLTSWVDFIVDTRNALNGAPGIARVVKA